MKQTGIFGGSFNPIHCGHIALAQEILRQTALDEIWLMVSPQNPLKRQSDLLCDNERLRLARKALRGIEGISASNFEFTLPRPSYTWNTLQALSKTYPDRSFTLIIGGDNWTLFDRWYHADDIRLHYPIVVYPRPGYLPAPHLSADSQLTLPPVTMVDCPLFDVSSTEIRQRARQGDSLEGLVPDPIIDDVKQLYQ